MLENEKSLHDILNELREFRKNNLPNSLGSPVLEASFSTDSNQSQTNRRKSFGFFGMGRRGSNETPLSSVSSSIGKGLMPDEGQINTLEKALREIFRLRGDINAARNVSVLNKEKEITQKLIGDLGLKIENNSTLNNVIDFIKELIRQPITDTSENTNDTIEDFSEGLSKDLTNISQSPQNDDYEKIKKEKEELSKQLRAVKRELLKVNKERNLLKVELGEFQENLDQKNIEEKSKLQGLSSKVDNFQKL